MNNGNRQIIAIMNNSIKINGKIDADFIYSEKQFIENQLNKRESLMMICIDVPCQVEKKIR